MRRVWMLLLPVALVLLTLQIRRSPPAAEVPFDPLAAVDRSPDSPGDRLIAIMKEEMLVEAEANRRLGAATLDPDRLAALSTLKGLSSFAGRLLAQVDAAPADPMALEALIRVVTRHPDTPEARQAAERIIRDHSDSGRLGTSCDRLADCGTDLAADVLGSVARSNPQAAIRGYAEFNLAMLLKARGERKGWKDPAAAAVSIEEAQRLLEHIIATYGELRDRRGRLVDVARDELKGLQTQSIGKAAPEIEGPDCDGSPMRLGEYRGKVVMIAFWGHWCSLCRLMLPHQRSLVERMKGRPFVLLGVNTDNSPTIPRAMMRDGAVTWRSWSDGGDVRGGEICRRWSVPYLPTVFLIDARGVIRHKVRPRPDDHDNPTLLDGHGQLRDRWQQRADEILEVVEALVSEAEGADPVAPLLPSDRPRR
jgi:peroxiredoxin